MTIDDDGSISVDTLNTPRPLEDDDAAAPPPPRGTLPEKMYDATNRSLKALALLSLGLLNGDSSPTYNPSVLPWSAALQPTSLKMTAKELRNEVVRAQCCCRKCFTFTSTQSMDCGKINRLVDK
jgi:hypothetical protein